MFGSMRKFPSSRLIAGAAVVALIAATPLVAHAWSIGEFFESMVTDLMYMLIQFFGWMTMTLFRVLETVATYNGFTTEPIVVKGWTIVRDVCNMFFVFAMLLIAFGTILRIQAYHYRSLLFKVVLMAVLMNLSKSIVGVLIDLSQIVMLSFVSGFKHMVAGSMAQALGITKLLQLEPTATKESINNATGIGAGANNGFVASAGTLLSSYILAMLIMALIFITVLAITVQLIVRVIKLWILTIMAPIAFAGTLFKGLGSMASKWWDELTKELVAGPTLMFFLWLVLAISSANSGEVFGSGSYAAGSFNPLNLEAASAGHLVNLFVVVGLLWAGLGAAKAGGTAAAGAVGFGLGKLSSISKGTVRVAGKGAAATGRWAGRWTREAGSRTGVNTALATVGEGFKATGVGKAATFFTAAATKKRWERRELARKQREVTQFAGIEAATSNLGMEKTTSWVQSAKQRRGARFKAEANKKVAERMKLLDEQGITDDATIRSSLDGNMKNGKVTDEIQQMALMFKLQKQGSVKASEAGDMIIKYTAGMQNEAAARASLKGVYKDSDTTRIKADGTVQEGAELEDSVSENLVNDVREADKVKRYQGIEKRVGAVDAGGNMTDQVALAMLSSKAFDADYFDKLGKQRQAEVERAYVLAISNTKDGAKKQAMVSKLNDVTRRSAGAQQQALDNAGSDNERAKLQKRFSGLSEIKMGADGRLVGDDAIAKQQDTLVLKQRNQADKDARVVAASNKPLNESEKELRDLAGSMDDARGNVDALRVALSELSQLDPNVDRAAWGDAMGRVTSAQEALVEQANAAAAKLGKTYVDENGVDISPEQMVHRSLGGDAASEVSQLGQRVLDGNLDVADFQKRAASMNTGINARFGRVKPNVRPVGIPLDGGGEYSARRDQADLAAFVPGMAKRYATPTQRVDRVIERGGRTGADPFKSDFGMGTRFEGASGIRNQIEEAFKKVTEVERAQALQPAVLQLGALIERLQKVERLDPVQKASLEKIVGEYNKVRSSGSSASKDSISKILGDIGKLGGLA